MIFKLCSTPVTSFILLQRKDVIVSGERHLSTQNLELRDRIEFSFGFKTTRSIVRNNNKLIIPSERGFHGEQYEVRCLGMERLVGVGGKC